MMSSRIWKAGRSLSVGPGFGGSAAQPPPSNPRRTGMRCLTTSNFDLITDIITERAGAAAPTNLTWEVSPTRLERSESSLDALTEKNFGIACVNNFIVHQGTKTCRRRRWQRRRSCQHFARPEGGSEEIASDGGGVLHLHVACRAEVRVPSGPVRLNSVVASVLLRYFHG